MGIFDNLFNKVADPTKPQYKGVLKKINRTEDDRTTQDIKDWRYGLEYWEDVNTPNREYLIKLYKDVELDGQVAAKVRQIERTILSQQFQICDSSDEPQEIDLNVDWFKQLVRAFVGAEMQGFSLFQMIYDKDADDYVCYLVPREYVQPDKGFIRRNINDTSGLAMYKPPFTNTMIYIGDRFDKGLFAPIAPLYIYKKNAVQYWANYQNKFGVPPLIAKTDLTNEKLVDDIAGMLENMASNSYSIVDEATEIESVNIGTGDGYATFQNLLDYCDAQISKILDGQTMTSDDGSSQAQATVHADVAKVAMQARINDFVAIMNSQVLPFLERDGVIVSGSKFKYIEAEDTAEIIANTEALSRAGYKVDAEWLSDVLNMPLDENPTTDVKIDNRY